MSEFLVSYDYGMGGVWGVAIADTKTEVSEALPELTVVEDDPAWLPGVGRDKLDFFRVGDETIYPDWFRILIQQR